MEPTEASRGEKVVIEDYGVMIRFLRTVDITPTHLAFSFLQCIVMYDFS
jgi:hypothetical protein